MGWGGVGGEIPAGWGGVGWGGDTSGVGWGGGGVGEIPAGWGGGDTSGVGWGGGDTSGVGWGGRYQRDGVGEIPAINYSLN